MGQIIIIIFISPYRQQKHIYNTDNTIVFTIVLQLFWILSGTTRVSWYQNGKTRKVKPIWIYWSKR